MKILLCFGHLLCDDLKMYLHLLIGLIGGNRILPTHFRAHNPIKTLNWGRFWNSIGGNDPQLRWFPPIKPAWSRVKGGSHVIFHGYGGCCQRTVSAVLCTMFVLCTVLPYDGGRVRVRAVTVRLRPCAGRDCRTADGYGRAHISAYGRLRPKASAKNRPAAASGAVFISDVMHCHPR